MNKPIELAKLLKVLMKKLGKENPNGRIYEEKEYLLHLEHLRRDIKNENLLGELDHPELRTGRVHTEMMV